jgi:hypothetical protein
MAQLEKTPRLKLPLRKKPYFHDIAPGVALGYRRNKRTGTWLVRVADGKGGNRIRGFAKADDNEAADDNAVLSYRQAHRRAGQLAGSKHAQTITSGAIPVTVDQAVDAYQTDLETRGGRIQNAQTIRFYLTDFPIIRAMPVSLLKKKDLQDWRNSLVIKGGPKGPVSRDTVNRVCHVFKTALNLAASNDDRISNLNAWKFGLANLPPNDIDDTKADKIMNHNLINAFVKDAWRHGDEIGRQFQTLAETGTRECQMLQIRVDDLQDVGGVTRIMMPSSKKGRARQVVRKPVPISGQLYQQLKQATVGKQSHEPIFSKLTHIEKAFRAVATSIGAKLELTPYAFRHSSIVRMLMNGVPASVVASHHDTSEVMIKKHYARYISNVSDEITRGSLPDFAIPKSKIVRIGNAA